MDRGIVSSATLMVNGPHSESAAKQVKGSGKAIGLHLNLARWRPVAPDFPAELLANGELSEARAVELPSPAVAAELEAQLLRLEAMVGARPTHVDVHKHLHRYSGV